MSPRGIYEISDYLATLINELQVEKIVALGAYPIKQTPNSEINFYITSTEQKYIDEFTLFGEIQKLSF